MQGYRTFIIAGASFLAPAIAHWGFKVNPDALADALIVVLPGLMALMRAVTKTPPGAKS